MMCPKNANIEPATYASTRRESQGRVAGDMPAWTNITSTIVFSIMKNMKVHLLTCGIG
jgi:hypothetical protein